MGRLFWKIFLAFWIALIVAAAGAGTVVWLRHEAADAPLPDYAAGPRGGMHMASAMLRHDGVDALREDVDRLAARVAQLETREPHS